ncbi:hypothetical protein U1P98_06550 [Lysinibacillus irui]|uniref:Uncharacterized protein n=1 Tax=Lysinibacillus irui TaxID=2998077 RepID=A0ABU5NIU0_9BACI|nr:hypothetical protein [Lysinibacillus irui]MEA0553573.1 hypothetical protein [Lysinibacillus irui]MEA0975957.1 hypothetical protein [Lysinibacillus irui]MEA1042111.1 hypothetical protein [Lysinibacillus irui]
MKSISLRFEGEYWDYLIKYNLLYLWTFNGELEIYNWEDILIYLSENKEIKIYSIFQGRKNEKLLIMDLLINEKLVDDINITLSKSELNKYLIKKYNTPTGELTISLDSYGEKLLLNTDEGLFLSELDDIENSQKIFDMSFYNLNIGSYGKVALSAGDDGVFGLQLLKKNEYFTFLESEVKNITRKHSNKAEWINDNIYNTSYIEDDYIFNFSNLDSISYNSSEIFKYLPINERSKNISWINNNKIYRAINNYELEEVTLIDLGNGKLDFRSRTISFQSWKGDLVAGAGTSFGTVVECENAMIVIFKNHEFVNIPGEVIRWKSYKSNERYGNLLGMIYDDEIVFRAFEKYPV